MRFASANGEAHSARVLHPSQFFRAASSGISTSFLILFLSEIMVIYLLATLIQLRASLPSSYGGGGGGETDPSTPPPTIPAPTDGGNSSSAPADGQPQPLLASLPDFNIVFGALFGESTTVTETNQHCSTLSEPRLPSMTMRTHTLTPLVFPLCRRRLPPLSSSDIGHPSPHGADRGHPLQFRWSSSIE